jgi:porin
LGAPAKVNDAYKVGAWYDCYNFDDQQYDTMRVPLASPLSNGIPAIHSPNYSIYGLIDKVIWLPKEDPNRYVTVFVRPMFTTLQDRNLISFSVNGGLTLHQPLPARDNDVFGLGFGVAKVSNSASAYDWDLRFYDPTVYTPVRSAETFIEATYQVQVAPGGRYSPTSSMSSIPAPGSPTRTIQRRRSRTNWWSACARTSPSDAGSGAKRQIRDEARRLFNA